MDIEVSCKLLYTIPTETGFIFQIEAAKADNQIVKTESLVLPATHSGATYDIYVDPVTLTRKVRAMLGPGDVEVTYQAIVDVDTTAYDPTAVQEFDFSRLPLENIEYVAPSRFCASDAFAAFAHETFSALPRGHTRVTAICDWIFNNIQYQSGSTNAGTTASDVFEARKGVCRDFAHLGISLCRALGIPARYASVYADALNPQDFHAIFQAHLLGPRGGEWFSFDPTRMSSVDSVVRIAAGRDAADVAFAWPQGEVECKAPVIAVRAPDRADTNRTPLAVSS